VLVYDCSHKATFQNLDPVWNELRHTRQQAGRANQSGGLWLIHNKIDMPQVDWQISILEGSEFAASIGAKFRCMSAKTGEGLKVSD
jgi:hypothetical protein